MQLVHSLSDTQIEELHRFYQNEWWSAGRSLDETRRCVAGSSLIFAFIDEGQLCGFARVVTDTVFKAFVFDVIVSPAHRNDGLGQRLVQAILDHATVQGVRHVELYCVENLKPWYGQFGFVDDVGPLRLMRRENR